MTFLMNYSIAIDRHPIEEEIYQQIRNYVDKKSKDIDSSKLEKDFDPENVLWINLMKKDHSKIMKSRKVAQSILGGVIMEYRTELMKRFYFSEYTKKKDSFEVDLEKRLKEIKKDRKLKEKEDKKLGKVGGKNKKGTPCPICKNTVQKCEIARHKRSQRCLKRKAELIKAREGILCADCEDENCYGLECELPDGYERSIVFGLKSKPKPIVDPGVIQVEEEEDKLDDSIVYDEEEVVVEVVEEEVVEEVVEVKRKKNKYCIECNTKVKREERCEHKYCNLCVSNCIECL